MKALILAGGQGLRLRPLTDDKPKPLVAVEGKPIAEWQLDWLIKNVDLEQATFLCGYKWTRLQEHFGSSYKGVRVDYSVEETPLGTGGAFRKAIAGAKLGDAEIVMMNGDIVTDLPLGKMVAEHSSAKGRPTVTLLLVPYKSRFGIVHIDKNSFVKRFEEKPEFADVWINGGIYVANAKRIFAHLPEKGDIERETFPKLATSGRVMAYPYRGFWSLIDSIKDIQEVEKVLK
ncbi:MAG TPA: nucleotidyltransferase family protein [Nitrososphaerales archaeon]|nr:nucleotidyltransferase family protein [Nitrososphaerales archaeon]